MYVNNKNINEFISLSTFIKIYLKIIVGSNQKRKKGAMLITRIDIKTEIQTHQI